MNKKKSDIHVGEISMLSQFMFERFIAKKKIK